MSHAIHVECSSTIHLLLMITMIVAGALSVAVPPQETPSPPPPQPPTLAKMPDGQKAVQASTQIGVAASQHPQRIVDVFAADLKRCTYITRGPYNKSIGECTQTYTRTPPTFSRFDYKSMDLHFCLALYDAAVDTCKNNTSPTPEAMRFFKANVEALANVYRDDMCKKFGAMLRANATDLERYLSVESNCEGVCVDGNTVSTNCLLLYGINSLSKPIVDKVVAASAPHVTVDVTVPPKSREIFKESPIAESKELVGGSRNTADEPKKPADEPKTPADESKKTVDELKKMADEPKKSIDDAAGVASIPLLASSPSPKTVYQQDTVDQISDNTGANGEYVDGTSETDDSPAGVIDETAAADAKQMSEIETDDESYVPYFLLLSVSCVIGYFIVVNKHKILALAVEGRPSRSHRRRPNTANYRKLDSNLEEAVTSACDNSVSHVIY